MNTYIVGHKNPDTDSVVAAIGLSELKQALGKSFIAAVAGDLNKETQYVLERFGFKTPELIPTGEKRVVLVDHNEVGQIHENILPEQIIGIFDHHKLGGLSTPGPISVVMRTVGSSSTIIYGSYKKNKVDMSPKVAGILLAGIISDTLLFTSPTTTEEDKAVASELEKISGVSSKELAEQMFSAKSDISDMSTEELIGKDYKVFSMAGKKVGIGVWETTLPQVILDRKDEIISLLTQKKVKESLDYILFAVVDIVAGGSKLIVCSEAEKKLVESAFNGVVVDGVLDCPGVVSRKKQITPVIEKYLGSNL